MKHIFNIFIISLFTLTLAKGQTTIRVITPEGEFISTSNTSQACNPKLIFNFVQHKPSYQGGLKALSEQLNNQLTIDKSIKTTSSVRFVVNCNNLLYGVQFPDPIDAETAQKIKHFLEAQQNWTAGKNREESVDCDVFIILKISRGKIKLKSNLE